MKYKLNRLTTISVTPAEKKLLDYVKNNLPKDDVRRLFLSNDFSAILNSIYIYLSENLSLEKKKVEKLYELIDGLQPEKIEEEKKLSSYKKATETYKFSLENEIKNEIEKIEDNDKTLNSLHIVLYGNQSKIPRDPKELKKKITNELLEQYIIKDNKPGIDSALRLGKHKNIINDLQKYEVIMGANEILQPKKFADNSEQVKDFLKHLKTNKATLKNRNDSGSRTFLKTLGVAAASVFGVGVGGFFAHRELFGPRSTKGAKFMEDVKQIRKRTPSK